MNNVHLPRDIGRLMTDLSFVVMGGSILGSMYVAHSVVTGWLN